MPRFRVLISDFDYGDNDIERSILEPVGAEVIGLHAKTEDDLVPHMADCDAVINQYARVGEKAIAAMKRCRVIARYGIGVDIVDVDAATARGIQVTNVRDYCTEEVADHAITLWLTLSRKILQYNEVTHRGVWHWKAARPVWRLRGRTMGIVSFGHIGQAIGERARAFGLNILVFDPYLNDNFVRSKGAEPVSKEELLARADAIMMQVPMTRQTRHFLGPVEFAQMKPGVIIVCTGRGPTVDNHALYDAIVAGRVAGAGLDDPEEEPAKRAHWDPNANPIFTLPNVIVTPHVAYYSEESIKLARETAASEVARVLTGQAPRNPVNKVPVVTAGAA
jgi:D-3-phosphoglycerate dehydrogenase / 2-oxoglutarate reductase